MSPQPARHTSARVETPAHKAVSNELLSRLLPAMGPETSLRDVSRKTEVPVAVLQKWAARDRSLPEKYHAIINTWIEQRTAVGT